MWMQWLDNLKEIKKETNISTKQWAEKANLPEKTVARILSGRTSNPYLDTLERLATAVGYTIRDILADTKVVVGEETLSTLQESLNTMIAERDLAIAENNILKDKVATLTAENDLLKMQLMHKEELLAVHNYYIKMNGNH